MLSVIPMPVDYLLSGDDTDDRSLYNARLIKRFRELEQFDADNQEAIIKTLEVMIVKNEIQGAVSPPVNRPEYCGIQFNPLTIADK